MLPRSSRPETRNPVLALESARKLARLPKPARMALRSVLLELSRDARERAEKAWRTGKPPMAAYWKAVAVYARHCACALNHKPRKEV